MRLLPIRNVEEAKNESCEAEKFPAGKTVFFSHICVDLHCYPQKVCCLAHIFPVANRRLGGRRQSNLQLSTFNVQLRAEVLVSGCGYAAPGPSVVSLLFLKPTR